MRGRIFSDSTLEILKLKKLYTESNHTVIVEDCLGELLCVLHNDLNPLTPVLS